MIDLFDTIVRLRTVSGIEYEIGLTSADGNILDKIDEIGGGDYRLRVKRGEENYSVTVIYKHAVEGVMWMKGSEL